MVKKYGIVTLLVVLTGVFLTGCGELGKVDQGRVIAYDAEKKEVTLIQDKKADIGKPDYTELPPHKYLIPTDPAEMGAVPKAGLRMKMDPEKKQITIFDQASQSFKTLDYTLVEQKEKVDKEDPLVKGKKFPLVDKEKKAITIYSRRLKLLTTFSLPEEYLSLPAATWDAGDEVRIYYKETGKALRMMNITTTDIFKK
jgi:hypothetical protein